MKREFKGVWLPGAFPAQQGTQEAGPAHLQKGLWWIIKHLVKFLESIFCNHSA